MFIIKLAKLLSLLLIFLIAFTYFKTDVSVDIAVFIILALNHYNMEVWQGFAFFFFLNYYYTDVMVSFPVFLETRLLTTNI